MPKHLPNVPKDDELERVISAATRQRDRLILLTMLYAGLRVSEVCGLLIEKLDFRRKTMLVRGKGDKDRVLPIPRALCGPLRGWIGPRVDGLVFTSRLGGEIHPQTMRKLVKNCAVRAKVPGARDPRRWHPHCFRHACATRALEAGATIYEVQQILGHSSIAVTQVYLSTTPEKLRAAIDRPYW